MLGKLLGLAALVIPLVGCGVPVAATQAPSKTDAATSIPEYETRMVNETWISPGKVEIANFYPGARAEWNIRVHNGNDEATKTQKILVGTDPGETVVPIILKAPLAAGDLKNVVAITSDLDSDKLKAQKYDEAKQELTITGFTPEISRTMTLVYQAWARFAVSYAQPSEKGASGYEIAPAAAQDWVLIADASPVLAPKETREILVTLSIPGNIQQKTIPDKWQFLVKVYDQSQTGMMTIELASRWLVTMR